MIHRVVVYLHADLSLAHVQSTNGSEWPGLVTEHDEFKVEIPLRRIELELEPTQAEIDGGENGQPRHRRAGVLLREELMFDALSDKVRYRPGKGEGGKIEPRDVR